VRDEYCPPAGDVFYERGVSSKNFSDASGKNYFFDRQLSTYP